MVVALDGLGTPGRSKSFHDAYYANMGDNTATLIDLSTVGAQVVLWVGLKPNQRIEVDFNDATGRVACAATVVWTVTPRLYWTAQGGYTRRRSNVELGEGLPGLGYRRLVVSTGLSWGF